MSELKYIPFKDIAGTIVRNRLVLTISIAAALFLGLFVYLITPRAYKSTVGLSIEKSQHMQGGLNNLANLAGINLVRDEGLDAGVYSAIVESTPYLLEVVNRKIRFNGDSVYLKNYLSKGMVTTFFQKVGNIFNKGEEKLIKQTAADTSVLPEIPNSENSRLKIIDLQGEERKAVNILAKNMAYELPRNGPPVVLEVTLQDPLLSAQAASIAVEVLSDYVNDYERDRRSNRLKYMEDELGKARKELYNAQSVLARARDRNRNLSSSLANAELDRLNMEYQLAYSTYNSLAGQVAASRIRLEEEKPVFIVIEPPVLKNTNSPTEPRLIIYVVFSIILGVVAGISIIFVRTFLRSNG